MSKNLPRDGMKDPETGWRLAGLGRLVGKRFGSRVIMRAWHRRVGGASVIFCTARCDCGGTQDVYFRSFRKSPRCQQCAHHGREKLSSARAEEMLRALKKSRK